MKNERIRKSKIEEEAGYDGDRKKKVGERSGEPKQEMKEKKVQKKSKGKRTGSSKKRGGGEENRHKIGKGVQIGELGRGRHSLRKRNVTERGKMGKDRER